VDEVRDAFPGPVAAVNRDPPAPRSEYWTSPNGTSRASPARSSTRTAWASASRIGSRAPGAAARPRGVSSARSGSKSSAKSGAPGAVREASSEKPENRGVACGLIRQYRPRRHLLPGLIARAPGGGSVSLQRTPGHVHRPTRSRATTLPTQAEPCIHHRPGASSTAGRSLIGRIKTSCRRRASRRHASH